LLSLFYSKTNKIESTYEIEYTNRTYRLKTTAKTLEELRNAIKTKVEIEESAKIGLEFKDNGKYIVLDDMEDLEEGMTIKVSISTVSTRSQQNIKTDGTFFFFLLNLFFFFLSKKKM